MLVTISFVIYIEEINTYTTSLITLLCIQKLPRKPLSQQANYNSRQTHTTKIEL